MSLSEYRKNEMKRVAAKIVGLLSIECKCISLPDFGLVLCGMFYGFEIYLELMMEKQPSDIRAKIKKEIAILAETFCKRIEKYEPC